MPYAANLRGRQIMHASKNRFTVVVLSVLSLAIMQSDFYQRRLKRFGWSGQVMAQTQANVPTPAPDVQLKIQIKEQRYCHASTAAADENSLEMTFSLEYINSGKDRLIFFRNGHHVAEYSIRRAQDNALLGKLGGSLFYGHLAQRLGPDGSLEDITPYIDTSTPSSDIFIVISPGESFRSEASLTIPIHVNENTQQAVDLSEGEHFLQVTLAPWLNVNVSLEKLRERWKDYGYLY